MEKIVYRQGVPCKRVQQGWKVRRRASQVWVPCEGLKAPYGRSSGSGQVETTVFPRYVFAALQEDRIHGATCDDLGNDFAVDVDLEALERKAELAKEKSQRRAKTNCRWKIKHGAFSSLLTLTYRENMTDFDRMHADLAAFLRITKREIPGFQAVWAFEKQKRGAWHCHMAIHRLQPSYLRRGLKVKSWEVARAAWRRVVGVDNGNVDVDGHCGKRQGLRKKSLAKLAGYVSKYLTKAWDETALYGRNMWGSTQGLSVPPCEVLELPYGTFADAIALAFDVPSGHRIASHGAVAERGLWWLFTEPDGG